MFVSLQDLEVRKVHFAVDIPSGEIDFDGKVTQASVLHAEGTAELVSHSTEEIRIQGELKTAVQAPCDRCLDAVSMPVEKQFDLVYVPASEAASGGEDEIEEAAVEVGYYEGNGLELNDVLREVVLLTLPMQMICKSDCKGICPVCGQNRNQRECSCQRIAVDDRWSKLKELRAEIGQRN